MEEETVVVFEVGSTACKADINSEEVPRFRIPSVVGRSFEEDLLERRDTFIGSEAEARREQLALSYPIQRGRVHHWEDFESLFAFMYTNYLKATPDAHSLLLSEVPLNPDSDREKMTELMFETFQTPGLYIANQACLALFASGRTTGLVLLSGDDVSHAVPVYESFAVKASTRTLAMGGNDLTQYLADMLREKGHIFETYEELRIVTDMKKCCKVALNLESVMRLNPSDETFVLPDGEEISLGIERFMCPEALFDVSLIGRGSSQGIHSIVSDAIRSMEADVRKHFYGNVLLTGSNTDFLQLSWRFQRELQELSPSTMAVKLVYTPVCRREEFVWSGGSIFASQSNFGDYLIGREDYDEVGPAITHRMCP